MPTHVTESTGASITATWEFSTGTLQVSTPASFQTDVISERSVGAGVTIDSVLMKDGVVTPSDAAGTRTALSAAKTGNNGDITVLSGLTSPLTVAQGGTSATSLTSGGLLYGNGTGAVQVTAAGTSSQLLTASVAGTPTWMAPKEYVGVMVVAPATVVTGTSDAAQFQLPFSGYFETAVAAVSTAPTGVTFTVDVWVNSSSIFSTLLWLDSGETTSRTSTTPAVISTATSAFSPWDTCRIHTKKNSQGAKGLTVTLVCVRTS